MFYILYTLLMFLYQFHIVLYWYIIQFTKGYDNAPWNNSNFKHCNCIYILYKRLQCHVLEFLHFKK